MAPDMQATADVCFNRQCECWSRKATAWEWITTFWGLYLRNDESYFWGLYSRNLLLDGFRSRSKFHAAFSRMTKTTRGRRSTMTCRTLDAIVRIQELGPDVENIPNALQTLLNMHGTIKLLNYTPVWHFNATLPCTVEKQSTGRTKNDNDKFCTEPSGRTSVRLGAELW